MSNRDSAGKSGKDTISLDVVIPSYEYPLGIAHILDSANDAPTCVRFFISDDSKSDAVKTLIENHTTKSRITYRKNFPPLGAVRNWNTLLAEATADYVMVLHHDEWPLENNFFALLVAELEKSPDVVVLNVLLPASRSGTYRSHAPKWLRHGVLTRWPDYLIRRNVVGAPSALVIRRSIAVDFDLRLRWLVDVDWYVRLLNRPHLQISVCDLPSLISLPHQQSITGSLGGSLRELKRSESKMLLEDRPSSWSLRLNYPSGFWERLLGALESCTWTVVRCLTLAWCSWLGVRKHDASKRTLPI